MGAWELLPESSEVAAVHAALLPNGQVVYYSGNTGPLLPAETRVWDPVARTVQTPPNAPETDLFCSGLSLLFDGRLLVVGGTGKYSDGPGDPWFGSTAAHLFQPGGGWQRLADMSFGRWYPSAIGLPDGRVLVVSGEGADGGRTEPVEIYDPFNGWQVLSDGANHHFPLYPRLHVLPNGEVACVGQGAPAFLLDLGGETWAQVAPALFVGGGAGDHVGGHGHAEPPGPAEPGEPPERHETVHRHRSDSAGPRPDDLSVLLPPAQSAKVLNAGGGDPAITDAFILDLSDPNPAWRAVAPMNHPRWFPNSAVLPDGTLFVVGGGRVYNQDPVMEPETFDPVSETWTEDVAMTVPRLYHSTALLLPDGRVWVAGTDGETRMELYSPDYLAAGPRPILFAAPASVTYDQNFPVPIADPNDVVDACFIRLSAVTHAYNMGQRHVPLTFAVSGAEEISIVAPADANLAPPGHYMLFVRNTAGVPAVAPIIQLVAV